MKIGGFVSSNKLASFAAFLLLIIPGCNSRNVKMDNEITNCHVYYISPQVLTRSAVQPEQLQSNENKKLLNKNSCTAIREFIGKIKKIQLKNSLDPEITIDFRFCYIDDKSYYVNSECDKIMINNEIFQIPDEYRKSVINLYQMIESNQ